MQHIIFLQFFLFIFGCFATGRELKYVQAIWRHGDRAPSKKPYANDPYGEKYWPRGWNQLTNLGMMQMKRLGEFFRLRYGSSFVGSKFNKTEIFIQSSETDRALVSAQAVVNGFFPPNRDDEFQSGLAWQPIAIHSSGINVSDPLLKPTGFNCPTYSKLVQPLLDEIGEVMPKRYRNLFEFLEPIIGNGTTLTLHQVTKLSDLKREIIHNLSQPEWIYKTWEEYDNITTLELVKELRRVERITLFNQTKLAYLRGGFLLGDWLKRVKKLSKGSTPHSASKMVLYSSHDGTLQALMHAMQVADEKPIPYGGALIMELYQADDGSFEVELLYRRDEETMKLELKNCSRACQLERFIDLLKPSVIYRLKKLYKECGLEYCTVS